MAKRRWNPRSNNAAIASKAKALPDGSRQVTVNLTPLTVAIANQIGETVSSTSGLGTSQLVRGINQMAVILSENMDLKIFEDVQTVWVASTPVDADELDNFADELDNFADDIAKKVQSVVGEPVVLVSNWTAVAGGGFSARYATKDVAENVAIFCD